MDQTFEILSPLSKTTFNNLLTERNKDDEFYNFQSHLPACHPNSFNQKVHLALLCAKHLSAQNVVVYASARLQSGPGCSTISM